MVTDETYDFEIMDESRGFPDGWVCVSEKGVVHGFLDSHVLAGPSGKSLRGSIGIYKDYPSVKPATSDTMRALPVRRIVTAVTTPAAEEVEGE